MTQFSRFISWIFHPLLLPTYVVSFILYVDSYVAYGFSTDMKLILVGLVCLNTFIMPGLFFIVMVRTKQLKSVFAEQRIERIIPLIMGLFFFGFNYFIFSRTDFPQVLVSASLAFFLTLLVAFLSNFFVKVSLHTISAASIFGILLGFSHVLRVPIVFQLSIVILLAGLVGSARLALKAHDGPEILLGYALGIASGILPIYLSWG